MLKAKDIKLKTIKAISKSNELFHWVKSTPKREEHWLNKAERLAALFIRDSQSKNNRTEKIAKNL